MDKWRDATIKSTKNKNPYNSYVVHRTKFYCSMTALKLFIRRGFKCIRNGKEPADDKHICIKSANKNLKSFY